MSDTTLINDVSINGNEGLNTASELSETLQENTVNAIGVDASSRTIWVNGQPYGNAYVNVNDDNTIDAPLGAEIFNDFEHNIAAGEYSHAEGKNTEATGHYAHAEGWMTHSIEYASHAEGLKTTASRYAHAEGNRTTATGAASHAEGYLNYAFGDASHSEGQGTESTAVASHAEGYYTDAKANYAHAEGQETYALNIAAHAEGYQSIANNKYTHAEGRNTDASGEVSHAEGHSTHATGTVSHAEGRNTYATGTTSHAENRDSRAIGESSHAEGNATRAYNKASHSEGIYTIAGNPTDGKTPVVDTEATVGAFAHAEGNGTWAKGNSSHAEGIGTIANNEAEHASGMYNVSNNDTIFSVGIGVSETDRLNAITINRNGDTEIYGGLLVNGNLSSNGDTTLYGSLSTTDTINAGGNLYVDENLTVYGDTVLGNTPNNELDGDGEVITYADTVTINATLDAKGNTILGSNSSDTLTVKAIPTFNQNVTMNKNLNVNGNTTLGDLANDTTAADGTVTKADIVTINAALKANGDVTLGTNSEDVITIAGNTTIKGNITGDKNLNIKGNITLGDADGDVITVKGTTNFKTAVDIDTTLNVGGNTTIGGTLVVDSNTTIGGTLGVTGKTSVSKLESSGKANLESLDVTNNASIGGALYVTGDTTIYGQSNFKSKANFASDVLVQGQSVNKGSVLFESTLKVNESAEVGLSTEDRSITRFSVQGSSLTTGDHQVNGHIHVGTSKLNTNLHVEGQSELNGDLYVGLKDSADGGDLYVNGDSFISGNEIVNNRLQIGTSNSESYNYNGLLVTNGNMMLHGYQLYYAGAKKNISPTYSFNSIFNCYGNGCNIKPCRIGVVGGSTNVACIDVIMTPNTISPIISISDKLTQNGIEFDTNVNSEIYIFVYLDTYNNPYVKNEQILRISVEDVYQLFNYQYGPNWFTFKLCFAYRPSIINNRGYPEEAIDSSEYDANDFNIRIFPKSSETIEHNDLVFATIDITDNGADYFNWINGNIYEFNCLNGSIIGTKIY